ncbi:MAG: zinc ribbon domain-containing protein [Blastocatellia bacterium]|nr:zinc ribbon domain-containing protein [Blastocatellia bacterium]
MGAEFIPAMADESGFYYLTEHDVERIMPGEVEAVRARLSEALEQIGFRVVNETPIQARRTGSESGKAGCSNDILGYPATLKVSLKPAGNSSTRAIFDYTVRNSIGYLSPGDRNTLTREVEAVIALANNRAMVLQCISCGAELSGARFCRQCGAPAATSTPAELDLLSLTAKTNVAYKWNVWGAAFAAIGLVLPALLFLLDQDAPKYAKRVRVITVLTGIFGVSGILMLLRGLWWMAQSLNQPIERSGGVRPIRRMAEVPNTASLPPAAEQNPVVVGSVTEATTDLLRQEVNRSL